MCKILLFAQKCNYGKIVKKFLVDLKASKLLRLELAIFFPTVCLREVILALWILKWVSASAYKRCPLTGVLVDKLPGPQFGVRLWEVFAYRRCPLAEARL